MLAAALSAASAALLGTAYWRLPHLFRKPLIAVNRRLSGLRPATVQVGPHLVHYLEGGKGEPVILLHGIFAEKDHWVEFARKLTGRYRVIIPDLPGHGESSRLPDQGYDYAAQTERMHALLDALDVPRAHLAGSSMGGTIAALYAMRHADRVASVAFVGAPHGILSPRPSRMDKLIDAGRSPLIARDAAEFEQMLSLLFVKRPFMPRPILLAARSEAIRNAESNQRLWREQLGDRHLLHTCVEDLRVGTLLLWGAGDRVFDVSGAEVLRSRLENLQAHVMQGVGHLPMMEAPGKSSQIYARFLASMPRRRSACP